MQRELASHRTARQRQLDCSDWHHGLRAAVLRPGNIVIAGVEQLGVAKASSRNIAQPRIAVRSAVGLVSRVTPVHTAVRNCTRDEGGPFEVGNQVLISSHRKLLRSKATVVNVAGKSERDCDRYG